MHHCEYSGHPFSIKIPAVLLLMSRLSCNDGVKQMKDMLRAGIACLFTLTLISCGGGGSSTPPPPATLTVSPSSATVGLSGTQQFNAMNGTTPTTATWSVNGVQGGNSTFGTIDSSGKYTAPGSFPSPDNFMVTATTSSASGNASLTVAFPNDNHLGQTPPIKLGTTGGNTTDSTTSGKTITCCSGTLGSLINKGGGLFILSNDHVLDKSSFGATGDPIGQPGLVDNNCNAGTTVANLTQAAALKPSPCTTTPCTGAAPSNVDAAIAAIVPGMVDPTGSILDLGPAGANSIAPAPPSSTLAVAANVLAANEGVAKSGRSSGLTCSNLQSVNTSVSVDYNSSCGGSKAFTSTFSNQVVINGGSFSAGGDSGSLVVTSDTARPVGLLYAGNNTSTTANPIQDVITALGPFTIVGGGDHTVSCDPTATASSASKTVGASSAKLSTAETDRVNAVKEKYAARLFANPAIRDISAGASADNPQEGALFITVSSGTASLPAVLDGVRTRIAYTGGSTPRASLTAIHAAAAIQEAHVQGLMAQPGIQGVGVGVSDDNPAEPAMVIYVITGEPHAPIPPIMDGLRTKIIEGDRFRAFGWGKETVQPLCSKKPQSNLINNKAARKLR